jgi:hypothetical protein
MFGRIKMLVSTVPWKSLCVGAVATILALTGGTQAFADSGGAAPFAAVLAGTAVWDGTSPVANCQGAGTATHLGQTTSQCTAVLDLSSYGPNPACAGEGTGNALPNVNTATLIAPNGDRLVLVSTDIACEIDPLTSFHATGVWKVHPSMSTGRFAGATGTGNCDAKVDFAAGIFEITYTGEIVY